MDEKMQRDVEEAAERCRRLIEEGDTAHRRCLLMRHEVGGEVDRLMNNHTKAVPVLGEKLGLKLSWLYDLGRFFRGYLKAELEEIIAARPPDDPPSVSDLIRLLEVSDRAERMKLAKLPPALRSPHPDLTSKRRSPSPPPERPSARSLPPPLGHDRKKMRNLRAILDADERAAKSIVVPAQGGTPRFGATKNDHPTHERPGTDAIENDSDDFDDSDNWDHSAHSDEPDDSETIAKQIGDHLVAAIEALGEARSKLEQIATFSKLASTLENPADTLKDEAAAFAERVAELMIAPSVEGYDEQNDEGSEVTFSGAPENPSPWI